MNFIEWFTANWYTNMFTLSTVLLSGVISLVISAAYYHKGNRNNLKMSVIDPIARLLDKEYSRKNYGVLCEISKGYSARYLRKKEIDKLNALLLAYKEVSMYNDISVKSEILFSYFKDTLKKNNIDPMPVPVEYEGEIVDSTYPPDLYYLLEDLEKVLRRYDLDFETEECKSAVISLYESYCKKYYTSQKIVYFDDYTLSQVLKKSKICEKWDIKFDIAKKAKEDFLNMKIAK